MQYIDLTYTFGNVMPTFPGDPASELKQIATIETEGFVDHEIKTAMHVGTHMDAPWHMLRKGRKLSEMPLKKFFGRGVLIDARGKPLDSKLLAGHELKAGDMVLFLTGFGAQFGQEGYYKNYPELSEELAMKLAQLNVNAVGLDTPSPDRPPFSVHKILFAREILIIENLTNLEQLVGKEFTLAALPAKFDTEAAPVRVVAEIK